MNQIWTSLLTRILLNGDEVSPRGRLTKEIRQATIEVDMNRPVITIPARKLSYTGMAAEAHWILSGSELLTEIEPYLPRMKEFSDDGLTLFGAYGPRIRQQIDYVVNKLKDDHDTRQATLTLWHRCPSPSKDVPCTVAMDFKLRHRNRTSMNYKHTLNMHVFMRSSDAWLGIPYDVFSFSMVAHQVCCRLNYGRDFEQIEPGTLYLTAASSHLYEENWLDALRCINAEVEGSQYPTPRHLWLSEPQLMFRLEQLRRSAKGDRLRWWESGQ